MNNNKFLEVVKLSFEKYLETGSRSNKKLKILHGAIANDIINNLSEEYKVYSLGSKNDKEKNMFGRYMDKKVDIAIEKEKEIISAIAVKYIMRNYHQNSNNYFENMLGETTNIRSSGKPYFQIVIMPSKIPYFKKGDILGHMEMISDRNLSKYIKLSNDDINECMHTPNKTLIYIIDMPEFSQNSIKNFKDYIEFHHNLKDFKIVKSSKKVDFGPNVIYNDYEEFIKEVCKCIESL